MRVSRRVLRIRRERQRRISDLMLVAGALVLLTPLLLCRIYASATEPPPPTPEPDNPVMLADPGERPEESDPVDPAGAEAGGAGAAEPSAPSGGDAGGSQEPPDGEPDEAPPTEAAQTGAGYRIQIPAAGVDYTVYSGVDTASLDRGPGHYEQTPHPGEAGNAAIAGHRTDRGRASFFYNLHQLEEGDPIRIVYPDRTLTFTVKRVFITTPYDLSVLAPTPYPSLTLTTCDPPGTDQNRLIVKARLQETAATQPARDG